MVYEKREKYDIMCVANKRNAPAQQKKQRFHHRQGDMTRMSQNTSGNQSNTVSNSTKNTANVPTGKKPLKKPYIRKELCKQLAKPFGFLLLLIMVCAFLAQYLTGAETLEEYAENNPELAYGTLTEADDTNDTADMKDITAEDAGNPAADTTDNSSAYNKTDTSFTSQSGNYTDLPPSGLKQSETESSDLQSEKENDDMNVNPERVTYKPGFYYEPISEDIKQRITGISYPVAESLADKTVVPAVNMIADDTTPAVSYDDLRYVRVLHYDFDGREKDGELICNKAIAQDMVEIFYELYQSDYQIEQIRLVDEYSGDDTLSMMDNNTSCFNYRVVDGTDNLSKHAYGLAIDINPFYNPYIVFGRNEDGSDYISPAGSEIYADRSRSFAYKIDETDLCYRLFKEHGFTWGGDWNSCKDYQHFQKTIE